ncbi:trypsin Inhibitor like cysteine rich domain protein [Teladorsagia circumcincta]|uniref:Trypsin Inhibitor like cysteine rich domain protein n=1 Tax=Teladorsagia circumcincta TaxID=45464 RepID=A0A2G9UU32_TELCI|nr:trypsin Inhibitor like cysteine rich domain protein [Teladorsagia circumcincta]
MKLSGEVCEENELLTDCGARCEATCIEPTPECEGDCIAHVCRCKQGFIRRELGGPCIAGSSCPPGRSTRLHFPFILIVLFSSILEQVPPSCDGIVCSDGAHCEVVDLPCANGTCSQQAICVDE